MPALRREARLSARLRCSMPGGTPLSPTIDASLHYFWPPPMKVKVRCNAEPFDPSSSRSHAPLAMRVTDPTTAFASAETTREARPPAACATALVFRSTNPQHLCPRALLQVHVSSNMQLFLHKTAPQRQACGTLQKQRRTHLYLWHQRIAHPELCSKGAFVAWITFFLRRNALHRPPASSTPMESRPSS